MLATATTKWVIDHVHCNPSYTRIWLAFREHREVFLASFDKWFLNAPGPRNHTNRRSATWIESPDFT
jgi:hypothetical protein